MTQEKPISVFTDSDSIPPINLCLLAKLLLGVEQPNTEDIRYGRFDLLRTTLFKHITLTNAENADVFLLPFDLRHRFSYNRVLNEYCELRARYRRPLIAFMVDDDETPLGSRKINVWRTSMRASLSDLRFEKALPAFCDDLVANYIGHQVCIIEKPDVPTVGFVGFSSLENNRVRFQAKRAVVLNAWYLGKRIGNVGNILRKEALDHIGSSKDINLDFQVNSYFYNYLISGSADRENQKKSRKVFVDNLKRNAYALAIRGNGNYSFRFYEALCMGRIPILIATDTVLPMANKINFERHCVVVPFKHRSRIVEYIQSFHAKLTKQEFVNLQYENREIWKSYLSPQGFFSCFARDFRKEL